MTIGTGAQGFMGVAIETVSGTYTPPTNYWPIESEGLNYVQDTVWRRPIRQVASVVGAVPGNVHIEGDISMEAFEDAVTMFLYATRSAVVKSGTTPNFSYTFTSSPNAVPTKTLSITVVRNGIVHGFTGCVVGSWTLMIEDGMLKFNPSILGRDEASQTMPTPAWLTGVQAAPYGAGSYQLQIPTSTQVFDADTFELAVDDSAEANFRLKDTSRGAQFIAFGEESVNLTIARDYQDRTDFDAFKALTAQSVTLNATGKGANNSISAIIPAAVKDTYEVGLSGQGDLTRASIAYQGVLDATGNGYTITTKTQLNVT